MAQRSKIIKGFFYALIISFYGCANQMPPSGGDIDLIPPEIVSSYPENRAVNFSGDRIEIVFSEYVDKRSVHESIFISPAVDGVFQFDWGEKNVGIIFPEILRQNTTYIFTIGTDVIDLNNKNHMEEAFILTFSTGNEIDNCTVKGQVYDKEPLGTMLFAYMITDTIPNPQTQKPHYITQAGRNGNFLLRGMQPAAYRIFAVKDYFKDLTYNIGDDYYGSPFMDVTLTKSDTLFSGLNFFLTLEDTTAPHIANLTMTDMNHILIEFTESIDSSKISAFNFSLFDSTETVTFPVKYFFKGKAKNKEMFLSFESELNSKNNHYLISKNIVDRAGNVTNKEKTYFDVSSKVDTIPPSVLNVKTEYGNNRVDFQNPYFVIYIDDGVDTERVENPTISDPIGNVFLTDIKFLDNASIYVTASKKLKQATNYQLDFNSASLIDAAGNSSDTVFSYKFQTINELDFSGAGGSISHGKEEKVFAVLTNVSEPEVFYKKKMSDYKFNFDRVIPGKYLLWFFSDADGNEVYTHGKVNPFVYSERFMYFPDTLNLRARWPVGDILIDYK